MLANITYPALIARASRRLWLAGAATMTPADPYLPKILSTPANLQQLEIVTLDWIPPASSPPTKRLTTRPAAASPINSKQKNSRPKVPKPLTRNGPPPFRCRQNARMPPFTRLAALIIEGEKEDHVIKTAKNLAATAPPRDKIHILGPTPAPLYMLRGKFRYRLLARADRSINLPDAMRHWVEAQNPHSSVRIKVDIDPMSFF